MSGFRQRRGWRRAVGVIVAYALFLHTLLAGLNVAHALAAADPAFLWSPSLCITGQSADDTIPGETDTPSSHVVHCVLCAVGPGLAGVGSTAVELPRIAGAVFHPTIFDAPVTSLSIKWRFARAPPP
jgi:hypothetical protein